MNTDTLDEFLKNIRNTVNNHEFSDDYCEEMFFVLLYKEVSLPQSERGKHSLEALELIRQTRPQAAHNISLALRNLII